MFLVADRAAVTARDVRERRERAPKDFVRFFSRARNLALTAGEAAGNDALMTRFEPWPPGLAAFVFHALMGVRDDQLVQFSAAMTIEASKPFPVAFKWQQEVPAGLMAAVVTVPICLAAGLLIFAPLGPDFAGVGVACGLWGAIMAGGVSAAMATSSFIVTIPRVSPALVQSSLIIALLSYPAFAGNHALIPPVVFLCGLLAGLWQILFGAFGIASVIKYTPHPVLAGFLNGVGLLVVASQFKPFFSATGGYSVLPNRPAMLALLCATAALMFIHQAYSARLFGPWASRMPGSLVGLIVGTIGFYIATWFAPHLDLGPTLGQFTLDFSLPLRALLDAGVVAALSPAALDILLISLVLALIATFEALLSFRVAQNLGDIEVRPMRDLIAQGVGNCSSALVGGACSAPSPAAFVSAYRAGARTRWVGIVCAAAILVTAGAFPQLFGLIPHAVLAAVLVVTGFSLLDRGSFKFVGEAWSDQSPLVRRRAIYDLLVILAVMSVTLFVSVIVGVIA